MMTRIPQLLLSVFLLLAVSSVQALDIQHWTTSNGVKVLFVESHNLPMLDVRLSFRAASSRDGELPGISSLVNGLLVEGSGELDASEVAEGFESVGAVLGHDSLRDMAWLSLRTLTDAKLLDPVVDLFSRVVAQPSFPDQAIERDRRAMLAALAQRQETIGSVTEDHFYQTLYAGHPYAIGKQGTVETIKAISKQDLQAFHQRYYVARNANLSLVGDLTLAQAKAVAEKLTARLKPGQAAEPIPLAHAPQHGKTVQVDFKTTQTHILQGLPVLTRNDPDYYALYLGNHILGGSGFSSRLMQKIREDRGLVYSVYSYFLPMEGKGPFQMGLQTRNDQVGEAAGLLNQLLEEFIQQGPTEEELEHAKKNITGGFALKIDSNKKIVDYLALIDFYDMPLDYLDRFNNEIMTVDAAQIRDAFRRRVQPQRMSRVIVGAAP